jgi:hypothetical protein
MDGFIYRDFSPQRGYTGYHHSFYPIALLYLIPFLTGELHASPRALWLAFTFGSVLVGPLASSYETFEMLPRNPVAVHWFANHPFILDLNEVKLLINKNLDKTFRIVLIN